MLPAIKHTYAENIINFLQNLYLNWSANTLLMSLVISTALTAFEVTSRFRCFSMASCYFIYKFSSTTI